MKAIGLAVGMGLILVFNGCSTTGSQVKASPGAVDQVNPQLQAFKSFGVLTPTPKGFRLTLSGDSLFKVGRTHLTPLGIQSIDGISGALKLYPQDLVLIQVYTDSSGTSSRNLKISKRRGNIIKDEMVKQGVAEEKITNLAQGDSNPVAPNDTPQNRAQNRRVEIDITTTGSM